MHWMNKNTAQIVTNWQMQNNFEWHTWTCHMAKGWLLCSLNLIASNWATRCNSNCRPPNFTAVTKVGTNKPTLTEQSNKNKCKTWRARSTQTLLVRVQRQTRTNVSRLSKQRHTNAQTWNTWTHPLLRVSKANLSNALDALIIKWCTNESQSLPHCQIRNKQKHEQYHATKHCKHIFKK